MHFSRFALYYAPPEGAAWTDLATAWLGWDMTTGAPVAPPDAGDLPVGDITARPRKYGLHGTIKPPFRLAEGKTRAQLETEAEALCARLAPVTLDGLEVAQLGRFLALRPTGEATALADLAAACVEGLDAFRAPAPEAELARRRAAGLTPTQEAHLQRWGYPYVMDEFRFHITLTGRLGDDLDPVKTWLTDHLGPLLPQPFHIPDMALVGEDSDGRFHLLHRYTLSG